MSQFTGDTPRGLERRSVPLTERIARIEPSGPRPACSPPPLPVSAILPPALCLEKPPLPEAANTAPDPDDIAMPRHLTAPPDSEIIRRRRHAKRRNQQPAVFVALAVGGVVVGGTAIGLTGGQLFGVDHAGPNFVSAQTDAAHFRPVSMMAKPERTGTQAKPSPSAELDPEKSSADVTHPAARMLASQFAGAPPVPGADTFRIYLGTTEPTETGPSDLDGPVETEGLQLVVDARGTAAFPLRVAPRNRLSDLSVLMLKDLPVDVHLSSGTRLTDRSWGLLPSGLEGLHLTFGPFAPLRFEAVLELFTHDGTRAKRVRLTVMRASREPAIDGFRGPQPVSAPAQKPAVPRPKAKADTTTNTSRQQRSHPAPPKSRKSETRSKRKRRLGVVEPQSARLAATTGNHARRPLKARHDHAVRHAHVARGRRLTVSEGRAHDGQPQEMRHQSRNEPRNRNH
ncbi:MAG: hypothetical protein AAFR23_02970 [Pseudomonadota bacterium]